MQEMSKWLAFLLLGTSMLTLLDAHALGFSDTDLKKVMVHQTCPGCDLSSANLSTLNLSRANLSGSLLLKADLRKTNLFKADLRGANLTDAKLDGAHLQGANLSKAYWINGKKCKKGSIGTCKR